MRLKGLLATWWLPATIIAVGLALQLSGGEGLAALRYERTAIAGGEVWRLIAGHWVHLGMGHFVLNAAGLVLVWYLAGSAYSQLQWLLVIAGSLVVMDAGFWILMPGLDWYVGLSGLLHGMLAAGVVGLWGHRRTEAMVIGAVLAAKLAYEIVVGPLPGSAATAGGAVITEAHLFGAVGGFLTAWLISRRVASAAPI